jgi:hypothetical protein
MIVSEHIQHLGNCTDAPSAVNYREYDQEVSGQVSLIGRIKSHPTVAEKHYPELFKIYFPNGVIQASAY